MTAEMRTEIASGLITLETNVGERGANLAGGQRQRVALGGALVAQPKVLILDKFTSSMDAETEGMISETIKGIQFDLITILVSRQATVLNYADNVFEISDDTLKVTQSLTQNKKRNQE